MIQTNKMSLVYASCQPMLFAFFAIAKGCQDEWNCCLRRTNVFYSSWHGCHRALRTGQAMRYLQGHESNTDWSIEIKNLSSLNCSMR